jgi:hypothetical protein
MKSSFFLNLTPTPGCGFCNQLYSIVGVCRHANEKNIKYIFISRYLKEIHGIEYCYISDILNMDKTNKYLKKYDIVLIDGYDFRFNVERVRYGNKSYNIDITEQIARDFCKNKELSIEKRVNLNSIKGDPYEYFKKKFFVDVKGQRSLFVTYSINDILFENEYETKDGFLTNAVNINYRELNYVPTLQTYNDGTPLFQEMVGNFVFSDDIIQKSQNFVKNNIDQNKRVNTIHLRLEDDAIAHWGRESKYTDLHLYKLRLEQNYIRIIKQFIEKDSITILLASDYDNAVVAFLRDNHYNFIQTPKLSPYRDVSAIIDMHIGQTCNNVCVGVQESTFSYSLFFRSKPDVKKIILYYTNVEHQGSILL